MGHRTRHRKLKRFLFVLLTFVFSIGIGAIVYIILDYYEKKSANIMNTLLALTAIVAAVATTIYFLHQRSEREYQKSYSEKLERAIIPNKEKASNFAENRNIAETNSVDALQLMMINLEDIKEFYTWGQKQAKTSFKLAFIMCIFGFALMVAAIFLPVLFQQNLQMAIIPAIGGVITELVAGTVLVVYKSSLAQFNHYHKVLHEDARFLSSINLLDRFSTENERDEMLKAIITSEIQMNLDELKFTHTNDEHKDKK